MALLPSTITGEMIAAADAAGASEVRVRLSYLLAHMEPGVQPRSALEPGQVTAYLRCSPPPCMPLRISADADLAADWEVV